VGLGSLLGVGRGWSFGSVGRVPFEILPSSISNLGNLAQSWANAIQRQLG
jgi:hypothetical protein